jgi:hypothetical protein
MYILSLVNATVPGLDPGVGLTCSTGDSEG